MRFFYAIALVVLTWATTARSQEIFLTRPLLDAPRPPEPIDNEVRFFLRGGFAYAMPKRVPLVSSSLGASIDVRHITRRLTLTWIIDIDDRRGAFASTSFGTGVGLFYGVPRHAAFAIESAVAIDWTGDTFAGPGLSTRIVIQPFFLPLRLANRCAGGPVMAFVVSALSVWGLARVDFTDAATRGSTLAFGAGLDLMHFIVAPIVESTHGFAHCSVRL